MTIKLSICIPTYNRMEFLGQALESVIAQATREIEIVVSDNASEDDTERLVANAKKRFPNIVYFRQAQNLGFDLNLLRTVELATGTYCWFLGSDDALADNAIAAILDAIGDADIYIADRTNMSRDLKDVVSVGKMLQSVPGERYDCSSESEIARYLSDAPTISGLFSYISSLIVRRSKWEAECSSDEFIGSGYIHVYRLLSMMNKGAVIVYVGRPLVMNRTGNDGLYKSVGYTRRRLTDLVLADIASAVFGNRPLLSRKIIQILSRQFFSFRVMLSDKRSILNADGVEGAKLIRKKYSDIFSGGALFHVKMVLWDFMSPARLDLAKTVFKRRGR